MSALKNHLKYYWLENYLETEVRPYFNREHHLASEHFFAIIEWKNPKFGKTKLSHLKPKDIEELFRGIYDKPREGQLEMLIGTKGIKLATASAILTILYPKKFSVYDIRVRKQLMNRGLWEKKPHKTNEPVDISGYKDEINIYFKKYLPAVKQLANENRLSLRDCDRALWAQDWYEDLRQFIKNVNNSGRRKSEEYLKQI